MTILFPTDFSPTAHNAYQYAIALAQDLGARIDLMHVYSSSFKPTDLYLSVDETRKLRVQRQTEMQEKMEDFCNHYTFTNIGDKLVYPAVFTDQEIVERTRKGADLVIMGTKGERNPINKLMGSVTTRLMMNAACPVLAIPQDAIYQGIKAITYATSFTANDKHFLEQLINFGNKVAAEISFLHVTDDLKIAVEEELSVPQIPKQISKFFVVNNPSVMEGVDEFILEHPTDILAMYVPKRGLWEQLFHVSFSKQMTFHTDTPLFVFHAPSGLIIN